MTTAAGGSAPSFDKGDLFTRPPWFDGDNYTYWKRRMAAFFRAMDLELWSIVQNGPYVPMKGGESSNTPKSKAEHTADDERKVWLDTKAIHILYCALAPVVYNTIFSCTTAKEIWDRLEVIYEGTSHVKEFKIGGLLRKYALFEMKRAESVKDTFTRFLDITNNLTALGRTIPNDELLVKFFNSLTDDWMVPRGLTRKRCDLTLEEVVGSIMFSEAEKDKRASSRRNKKSRTGLKLKVDDSIEGEFSSTDEESDDEYIEICHFD